MFIIQISNSEDVCSCLKKKIISLGLKHEVPVIQF